MKRLIHKSYPKCDVSYCMKTEDKKIMSPFWKNVTCSKCRAAGKKSGRC